MSRFSMYSFIGYDRDERIFRFVTHSCGCCSDNTVIPHASCTEVDSFYNRNESSDEEISDEMDKRIEWLTDQLAKAKETRAIWLLHLQDKQS